MKSDWRRGSLVGALCVAIAAVGLVASASGPAAGDSWPGFNGKIAYKSDPNNIWTIAPDGTTPLQLTTGTMENEEPHWSSDGTKILFTRAGAADNSNQDIWSMNADGSNQVRLNQSTGDGFTENPSWSPDGTKIIFTKQVDGGNHEELWTANADGSGQVQLTNDLCNASSEAVYSPDGSKIAFQLEPNFCNSSASAAGSGQGEATDHPTTVSTTTVNGQVVVSCEGGFGGEIWVMNADGSGAAQVTNHTGCYDENPNWSPDGTAIAFTSNQTGGDQVWKISPTGTGETQLTSNGGERPGWSPDGTKIAFATGDQIWVMNANGSSPVMVTSSDSSNNGQPNWQPLTATLTVNKVVSGLAGAPAPFSGPYRFDVSCTDGHTTTLAVTDATAGGTASLTGISPSATCTVAEEPVTVQGLTVVPTYAPAAAPTTGVTFSTTGQKITITVTNDYATVLAALAAKPVAATPRFTG